MATHTVADADEIDEGEHLLVQLEGRFIGIYNIDGNYYAYTDWCPHQSGPICEGEIGGTTRVTFDRDALEYGDDSIREWVCDGEIVRCPWHAWEFNLTTGESMHDSDISLISHEINVEDGEIVVSL